MAKAKRARLKKNPEIADYVVEATTYTPTSMRQQVTYAFKRELARDFAKEQLKTADRVRVFHMSFKLVSDRRSK